MPTEKLNQLRDPFSVQKTLTPSIIAVRPSDNPAEPPSSFPETPPQFNTPCRSAAGTWCRS